MAIGECLMNYSRKHVQGILAKSHDNKHTHTIH